MVLALVVQAPATGSFALCEACMIDVIHGNHVERPLLWCSVRAAYLSPALLCGHAKTILDYI